MATIPTGTTSSAETTSADLQRIEREVKRIQQQLAQKNSGKQVQEFQKDSRDVKFENNATARDIGKLTLNDTRLNLFSSLTVGDQVDIFRFKVTSTAATTLSILNADQQDEDKLRFQVFNKASGRLIADSKAQSGDEKQAFEDLRDGKLELASGDYVLRISRASNVGPDSKKELSYAVQLSQGLYSKDYDTVERAARATDDPFGLSSVSEATNTLTSSLASGVSFMNSLPKIGTPATQKLLGMIIDGSF